MDRSVNMSLHGCLWHVCWYTMDHCWLQISLKLHQPHYQDCPKHPLPLCIYNRQQPSIVHNCLGCSVVVAALVSP
jgi:hypothetical protein